MEDVASPKLASHWNRPAVAVWAIQRRETLRRSQLSGVVRF
jgi:hypothetical protein